jgi:hypothetical protein
MRVVQLVPLFLPLAFTLGSCSLKDEPEINIGDDVEVEVFAEEIEPLVSYPIKITQRNIWEHFAGSESSYFKFDSLEIVQVSDSSYYFHYFKMGRPAPTKNDTLILPKLTVNPQDTLDTDDAKMVFYSPFYSPGIGKRLFLIHLNGKEYKVIEENHSCCDVWEPRGHLHLGSSSYFSLDFGMLGVINRSETSTSKTLWTADWDQKTVDKLVDFLPLGRKHL